MEDSGGEKDEKLLERLKDARPSEDHVDRVLRSNLRKKLLSYAEEEPHTVGRYRLRTPIGSGSFGTVYSAEDPSLERRVAIKALSFARSTEALLTEGKVLAKIKHPHVLPVYDVIDDASMGVCLVMEEVPEGNLSAWLTQSPRTLTEVVDVFVQAAEGLAAVHRAGLIHGDFKAQNVLVSSEGAKVADFGLAFDAQDTVSRVGTLAFAAPELVAGQAATAASDQYAFFAALAHALSEHERPNALEATIQRGLRSDPAQRYPSMMVAADALKKHRSTHANARRWVLLLALLLLSSFVAFVAYRTHATHKGCDGTQLADAVWDAQRRDALVKAHPFASTLATRLDQSQSRWSARFTEVCRDDDEFASQSKEKKSARLSCMKRQLTELRAFVSVLSGASQKEVVRAMSYALPKVDACMTPSTLSGSDRVFRSLALARSHFALGQYGQAKALVDAKDAEASPLEEAMRSLVLGRVLARLGEFLQADEELRQSLRTFVKLSDRAHAGEAALALMKNHALSGQPQKALAEGTLAEALLVDGAQRALFHRLMGEAHRLSGEPDAATRHFDQALAENLSNGQRALLQMNIGSVALSLDDVHSAHGAFEKALDFIERDFGKSHPGRALYLNKLGDAKLALCMDAEAVALQQEALAIRQRHYGPADPATASSALRLCEAYLQQGSFDKAKAMCERARDIRVSLFDESHSKVAHTHLRLGDVAYDAGFLSLALIEYEKADRGGSHWVRCEAQAKMLSLGQASRQPLDILKPKTLSELRLFAARVTANKDESALISLKAYVKGRSAMSHLVVLPAFFAMGRIDEARVLIKSGLSACEGPDGGLQRALRELERVAGAKE